MNEVPDVGDVIEYKTNNKEEEYLLVISSSIDQINKTLGIVAEHQLSSESRLVEKNPRLLLNLHTAEFEWDYNFSSRFYKKILYKARK